MAEREVRSGMLDYARVGYVEECAPMRSGEMVVVGQRAGLEGACVRCGAEAAGVVKVDVPVETTLTWRGDLPAFRLVNIPPVKVRMGLCARHLRARRVGHRKAIVFGWTALAAAAVAVSLRDSAEGASWVSTLICAVCVVLAAVGAFVGEWQPRVHHLAGGYFYLSGCGKEFVQRLPEVGGEGKVPE